MFPSFLQLCIFSSAYTPRTLLAVIMVCNPSGLFVFGSMFMNSILSKGIENIPVAFLHLYRAQKKSLCPSMFSLISSPRAALGQVVVLIIWLAFCLDAFMGPFIIDFGFPCKVLQKRILKESPVGSLHFNCSFHYPPQHSDIAPFSRIK